jgi:HAD superfamily hydrolase (TIGR01484 family)
MRPFAEFPSAARTEIRYVLTDIDDTLTHEGRLSGTTYLALERLYGAGFKIIPVTAGSSGWCDLIARMWPVDAVIGENGGFYFGRGDDRRTIIRRYWSAATERDAEMRRLTDLAEKSMLTLPGTKLSADQRYRETTLAITSDAGELPDAATAADIARLLAAEGGRTTINTMWVLGWLGGFDKLAMTRRLILDLYSIDIEAAKGAFLYVGDSLNDEPMFKFFPNSVGVSSVTKFCDRMSTPPRWITRGSGGAGFTEVATALLGA